MTTPTETTILLDIYERLGKIETKLEHVEKLEDKIKDLEDFKSRVGAYLWLGGSIASGALFLLYEGIKYGFHKWIGS
jgi:hypothetical protein